MSPERRRRCIKHVREALDVSERRACRVLSQHRSTQRKTPKATDDEAALRGYIVKLAQRYGRYGYRRITALLRRAGWVVKAKLRDTEVLIAQEQSVAQTLELSADHALKHFLVQGQVGH